MVREGLLLGVPFLPFLTLTARPLSPTFSDVVSA